jgi:hypothetical protein
MFAVNNVQAKLASMNTRAEKHGEEPVPATDLKFKLALHSSVLHHFHPGLRSLLYRGVAKTGEQKSLLPDDQDGLTELALPNLEALKFNDEFPGYFCGLTVGLDASDVLKLKPVKLYGFSLEALNGGTVNVSFSVTAHPTQDQVGELYELIQREVQLTLTPPDLAAEPDGDGPQGELLDGSDAVDEAGELDLEKVVITAIELRDQKNHLTLTVVTLDDDEQLELEEVAYLPNLEQVLEMLAAQYSLDGEPTQDVREQFAETD